MIDDLKAKISKQSTSTTTKKEKDKKKGDGNGNGDGLEPKKAAKTKTKTKTKKKQKTKAKLKESALKEWMEKNEVFEKTLYGEMLSNDVESLKQLKALSQKDFDGILRKVRVARHGKSKDQKKKKAIDQELVRFEQLSRKTKTKKTKKQKK